MPTLHRARKTIVKCSQAIRYSCGTDNSITITIQHQQFSRFSYLAIKFTTDVKSTVQQLDRRISQYTPVKWEKSLKP